MANKTVKKDKWFCVHSKSGFISNFRAHSERGATMLETALGLGFFLFLIFCLFSILWTAYQFVVAQYLATEAVRRLVVLTNTNADGNRALNIINSLTCSSANPLCGQNYLMSLARRDIRIESYDSQNNSWSGDNGNFTDAGNGGDFVRVTITVNAGALSLVMRNNSINMGNGLNYNQNFSFSGMAIGRNEPIVDR
ncbi:MAG: hypothetical protein LBE20_02785 [Deltaproteobacteria bacterium]|jgi:Flp pilus assembly protein TadG|nr:hypothetical protein [Deltaproteobacteria bacterium]